MLTRLALLLVRPSEGHLDQEEQRRIGRQRWAMWLIILYNFLAWVIFAIGDGSKLLGALLPDSFTTAVTNVIETPEAEWLPLLIIPYGISALFSIDVHLNASASWSANDVHDKRVKATFSTAVIFATSVFVAVYLVWASYSGIGNSSLVAVRTFPFWPLLTGVVALLAYLVTPWGLLKQRNTKREKLAKQNLDNAWSAFALLDRLPDTYQVWSSPNQRTQMENDFKVFGESPSEYQTGIEKLWNGLRGRLQAVKVEIHRDVTEGIGICEALGQLIAKTSMESYQADSEVIQQRAKAMKSLLGGALDPGGGELDMSRIAQMQGFQDILKTDQKELHRLCCASVREHGEQKLKILERLVPDLQDLGSLRKELAELIERFSPPVLSQDVTHLDLEAEAFFQKLTSRLETTKEKTTEQLARGIRSSYELAECIKQRGLASDRRFVEGYVQQLKEMEVSLKQMLVSGSQKLDMLPLDKFEEWKTSLESRQKDLCALYSKSVLAPNADVLSRLESLVLKPEEQREYEHLREELAELHRQADKAVALTDVLKVDEEVRRVFQESTSLYAPLLTGNADTLLESIGELKQMSEDLTKLSQRLAISWSPGIGQRLESLREEVASHRQQLNKEPLVPQILHDAWRGLADAGQEVRNLTDRIEAVISEAVGKLRDRFSPHLGVFQQVSELKRWDGRRQQDLKKHLEVRYGLISDGIERQLLSCILGNEELANLLTGG